MRAILSAAVAAVLAVQPALAAGSGADPGRFQAAVQELREKAGRALELGEEFDADGELARVEELARTPQQKSVLARVKPSVTAVAPLRRPVAAKPGPPPDGAEPDILDARYKEKLLGAAAALGADGEKAAETRRALLRAAQAGPGAKPGAAPGAQPPTPEERAAIARMEARAGQAADARAGDSARRIAAAMDRFGDPGAAPGGRGAAPGGQGAPAAGPAGAARGSGATEAELLGVANAAFKGGPSTLATRAPTVPAAHPAAAPEQKGWWGRFRDATTWDGAQHWFEEHNREHMAAAAKLEDRSAASFAEGRYVSGSVDAVKAWGRRLWAGDAETVRNAAIGVGGAVALAVTAPVAIPAIAAGGFAAAGIGGATVASTAISAGLYGLTAYNVVNGTGHLLHKPDLTNAALLVANGVAIPGLGKASEAIVHHTVRLTTGTGRVAAESVGAVTLAAAAPELAVAGGTTAARATVGGAVEAAAATESVAVQVAARSAPAAEHLAVRAVEGVAHNAAHAGAHKATSVDGH